MKQIIIAVSPNKFVRERFFEYEDIKFIEQVVSRELRV